MSLFYERSAKSRINGFWHAVHVCFWEMNVLICTLQVQVFAKVKETTNADDCLTYRLLSWHRCVLVGKIPSSVCYIMLSPSFLHLYLCLNGWWSSIDWSILQWLAVSAAALRDDAAILSTVCTLMLWTNVFFPWATFQVFGLVVPYRCRISLITATWTIFGMCLLKCHLWLLCGQFMCVTKAAWA